MARADSNGHSPPDSATSPAQLAAWLRSKAATAENILSISMLCHAKSPAKTTCLIGVKPEYARILAAECSGEVYGYTMVIVPVRVPEAFTCGRRPDIPENCSCVAFGG